MNQDSIVIRPVEDRDTDFILRLNEENVEVLAPMDEQRLEQYKGWAELFLVAEVDGKSAAFLIAIREGNGEYESENYRWFNSHYDSFLYVDRIVIDTEFRRAGLGRELYGIVFEQALKDGVPLVTAEIDIEPDYNEGSIRFHEAMGFKEVDTLVIRNGKLKVSLQTRKMP